METKRRFWHVRPASGEAVENGTPVSAKPKRPRRRMKVILACALVGALGGFLFSYVFPAKYTSQSTVLVAGQRIPDNYVQPIITSDFTQRIQTLGQTVLSPSRLRPMVQTLGIVKPEDEAKLISGIQQNVAIGPVITAMSAAAAQAGMSGSGKEASTTDESVPGFNVSYTDTDPFRAQKVCSAITSAIVDENLRSRAEISQSTTDFLDRQAQDAKSGLEEMDVKLLLLDKMRSRDPASEVGYKVVAIEHDVAEAFYKDLLVKKNAAALSTSMESQQQGEQMHILTSAAVPDAPDSPNRQLFALWGLGAGLLLGIGRALWPAARTV
jgi:uncharacterized protein involved in exopolysaccharide biosynthesis